MATASRPLKALASLSEAPGPTDNGCEATVPQRLLLRGYGAAAWAGGFGCVWAGLDAAGQRRSSQVRTRILMERMIGTQGLTTLNREIAPKAQAMPRFEQYLSFIILAAFAIAPAPILL